MKTLSKTLEIEPFSIQCSEHFIERCVKRSISNTAIQEALLNGEYYYKQGLVFCVIGRKNKSSCLNVKKEKCCKNIVVIINETQNILITTYRNNNPHRGVKKLSKRKLNRL